MSAAFYRGRSVDSVGGMYIRLRCPHSLFVSLSALNPQYQITLIGDGEQTVNLHGIGEDNISHDDRLSISFAYDNKYIAETQCRKLPDALWWVFNLAYANRRVMTRSDINDLSLSYLPVRFDEDERRWLYKYYIEFLGEKMDGEEFYAWSLRSDDPYAPQQAGMIFEDFMQKMAYVAWYYNEHNRWVGT